MDKDEDEFLKEELDAFCAFRSECRSYIDHDKKDVKKRLNSENVLKKV
ncbi:hypothetical protein NV379_21735 [Paenibacillus sp. N1-5-1-14]|nr:hypothetical protein [Paenibacillus radicibacter]MCR8645282.1 hypothetical protein [Paenibacillus radicibacter]